MFFEYYRGGSGITILGFVLFDMDCLMRNSHLFISHFPLTHLFSVNGVSEPCRYSDQFFIRGELLLIHFPLPTYPFFLREGN